MFDTSDQSLYQFEAKFENEKWSVIGELLHFYTSFNVAFMNNQFISFGNEKRSGSDRRAAVINFSFKHKIF